METLFTELTVSMSDFKRNPAKVLCEAGVQGCYKIKLRKQGYRLVYVVENEVLIVLVLAVDKREDAAVCAPAISRLNAER